MSFTMRFAIAAGARRSLRATVQAEFTAIAGWNNQLFPSYVVGTPTLKPEGEDVDDEDEAVLGYPHGLFGIEIESPGDDVTGSR